MTLEPAADDSRGDVVCSRRNRAYSDPLFNKPSDDAEFGLGSTSCSDTMSIASSQLHPQGDDSSVAAESESDSESQQEQTCPSIADEQPQQQQQQQVPMYYWYAMPGTPLWHQFTATNTTISDSQANMTCAEAAAARLQKATLEAEAAQLELQAARLKERARLLEGQGQGIAGSAPWMQTDFWPTFNASCHPQYASVEPSQDATSCPPEEMTTVMLRNIPNDYTRAMLLEEMDSLGLRGTYDFVYLPIDFHRKSSLGYAFVNFNRHEDAVLGKERLHGFSEWRVSSQKVCSVCWGEPLQGQSAHIERYRSSPVMHPEVPDEFKPIIFKDGVRASFPPPTKRLRPPRAKRNAK